MPPSSTDFDLNLAIGEPDGARSLVRLTSAWSKILTACATLRLPAEAHPGVSAHKRRSLWHGFT